MGRKMNRVLITGAAGGIGTSLRGLLRGAYPELVLSDRAAPADLAPSRRPIAREVAGGEAPRGDRARHRGVEHEHGDVRPRDRAVLDQVAGAEPAERRDLGHVLEAGPQRQQVAQRVHRDERAERPRRGAAAVGGEGREEQRERAERQQHEPALGAGQQHPRGVQRALVRRDGRRHDAADAVHRAEQDRAGHDHRQLRGEPAQPRDRARDRQRERSVLQLAGDRADAHADREQPAADEEERMLEADRRPLRERIEVEQVVHRPEHLRLLLEHPVERVRGREQGHEQEAPGGGEEQLEQQADALLVDEPVDQRPAHGCSSP